MPTNPTSSTHFYNNFRGTNVGKYGFVEWLLRTCWGIDYDTNVCTKMFWDCGLHVESLGTTCFLRDCNVERYEYVREMLWTWLCWEMVMWRGMDALRVEGYHWALDLLRGCDTERYGHLASVVDVGEQVSPNCLLIILLRVVGGSFFKFCVVEKQCC